MRNLIRWTLSLVFGLGMALACEGARADEEKIPVAKVPKAVIDAVKARYPGSVIKGAEKEEEEGQVTYELKLTHQGNTFEVTAKSDGKIVAVEKEIKVADLPAAVTAGIKAKYPKAKLKSAEEVEEDGKITYEVVVEKSAGKEVELTVSKAGKILEEDEDTDQE
jgi:uncharacterized membrane protein YkoI